MMRSNARSLSGDAVTSVASQLSRTAQEQAYRVYGFNVSHSGDMALYAFTHTRQIGVDIEHLREVSDIRQIVQRFFSPHEQAEWLRLPVGQQTAGFF